MSAPAAVVPFHGEPALLAWIVGTPGEYDASAIFARTELEARLDWLADHIGGDECEEGGAVGANEDCDCEACSAFSGAEATREQRWDGRDPQGITPADWLRIGWGHICSRCGDEASADYARAVGERVVCDDCMTLADWDIVDPEYAAEIRADLEGETASGIDARSAETERLGPKGKSPADAIGDARTPPGPTP